MSIIDVRFPLSGKEMMVACIALGNLIVTCLRPPRVLPWRRLDKSSMKICQTSPVFFLLSVLHWHYYFSQKPSQLASPNR